jgi:hypothetical protein
MRSKGLSLLLAAAAIGLFVCVGLSQEAFDDAHAEYTFGIPDAKWKVAVRPTATLSNADLVFGDRTEGLLEIRKLTVAKDQVLSDLIHGGEEAKLSFRPGFVAGKDENFSGRMRGSVFNYEYVGSGKSMAGRSYYLRANDTTVYLLKFSGPKDNIRSFRTQADAIARTFALK